MAHGNTRQMAQIGILGVRVRMLLEITFDIPQRILVTAE